jgi:hypothetical protein
MGQRFAFLRAIVELIGFPVLTYIIFLQNIAANMCKFVDLFYVYAPK